MDHQAFVSILDHSVKQNASDIHLKAGYPPFFRINGFLVAVSKQRLLASDTIAIANYLLEERGLSLVQKANTLYTSDGFSGKLDLFSDIDTSYELINKTRFRTNLYKNRGAVGIAMRVIPHEIKGFSDLNLPDAIEKIAGLRRGLILVAGATGMGKSTTIATLLDHINKTRADHVLTIEDPIEFVFQPKQAVITQREIPTDTQSFTEAIRAAMRQNPDILMIGEMRNMDTAEIALKASETGHLVISSLHTSSAVQTLGRFVSFFEPSQQPIIRLRLADNLMAVISLRLLPRMDKAGLIPAVEILRATRTIQECMKSAERTHEILGHMARGREFGMQTFDQHLIELIHAKKISKDVGMAAATSPSDMERELQFGG
ncbi:MAG: PilT/PilU family type 4a pilus ATPase [Nitrospirota bacterium]